MSTIPWWATALVVLSVFIVAIALAMIFYVLFFYRLWKANLAATELARKVFETRERPYIGVSKIAAYKNEGLKTLTLELELRNFGHVPANEVRASWTVLINSVEQESTQVLRQHSLILPQAPRYFSQVIPEPHYSEIVNGRTTLETTVLVQYVGCGDTPFSYRSKFRFAHDTFKFRSVLEEST